MSINTKLAVHKVNLYLCLCVRQVCLSCQAFAFVIVTLALSLLCPLRPVPFLEILCRRYAQIFLSEARLLPDEVSLSNSDSNGCVE